MRVLSVGTLFVTYTLGVDEHPAPSSVSRAHSVTRTRGGSASTISCILAQFHLKPFLLAPIGGNDEARLTHRKMEREGVSLKFCKIWPNAGTPTAWVLQAARPQSTAVVNHNPLPDITHEEFISILGPVLAPENYPPVPQAPIPTPPTAYARNIPPSPSVPCPPPLTSNASSSTPSQRNRSYSLDSPAPFEWIHFEGRSVKTTLTNITGLDGLARERKWRSHCVFSVDIGRRAKQGVEVLIPHADVLFLTKSYAISLSPHYASSPRSFLLSMSTSAPPNAILIAHWGTEGNAVLSLPTQEYFQSSKWVDNAPKPTMQIPPTNAYTNHGSIPRDTLSPPSVRSGSDYYAGGRTTPSSSEYSDDLSSLSISYQSSESDTASFVQAEVRQDQEDVDEGVLDEVGAQDAFVAGMIYALNRRLLPGPGTAYAGGEPSKGKATLTEHDRVGRWKLDECLRFATELSGRKARRRGWDGLAAEMEASGWFKV